MNHANFFPFERNRYFYGKLLTVRDFEVEQRYHCSKRALLNRLLHGSGVVCGLGVTASDESTLMIESGMALDYQGREIVLPETLFRKLQMLEGQETLAGKKDAYLCLSYAQEDVEPVNATGAEVGSQRQFDLTREGYRLFLTTEPPAYQELLEAAGEENVSVLYQSDDLILVLSVPSGLYAGEEFQVRVLVVKTRRPRRYSSPWRGRTPSWRATTAGCAWPTGRAGRRNGACTPWTSPSGPGPQRCGRPAVPLRL